MNTGILTKVGNLKIGDYLYKAIEEAQIHQDVVDLALRFNELSTQFGENIDFGRALSGELQRLISKLDDEVHLSTYILDSLSTSFDNLSTRLSTSISTMAIDISEIDIDQLRNISVQLHNVDVGLYETLTSYYATTKWVNETIQGLDDIQTTSCFVTTDLETISTQNRRTGDIAIVNSTISTGKTSKTAYCWNSNHWEALDGNYSADNVYFDEDLALDIEFGKYGSGTGTSYQLPSAGKSLKELLLDAFSAGGQHGTNTLPTFSFSINSYLSSDEVGKTYTLPTATLQMMSQGKYQYGSVSSTAPTNNTGIQVEKNNAYVESPEKGKTYNTQIMKNSNPVTCEAGTTSYTFEDSDRSYTYSASATYTQGDVPLDSLGAPDENNRIPSGTYTATKAATFKGQRYKFWGYRLADGTENVLDINSLISDDIRTGIHCNGGGTEFPTTFTCPIGTKQIIFAAAHDTWKKKINLSHPLAGQLYFDNDDMRVQNKVNVKGYNNYQATPYDIWYLNIPSKIRAEMTYNVSWENE